VENRLSPIKILFFPKVEKVREMWDPKIHLFKKFFTIDKVYMDIPYKDIAKIELLKDPYKQ
jgi:hypothetical protein